MKREILVQMMADDLKKQYDYVKPLDAVRFLKPLYSHYPNLRVGDYINAHNIAFGI